MKTGGAARHETCGVSRGVYIKTINFIKIKIIINLNKLLGILGRPVYLPGLLDRSLNQNIDPNLIWLGRLDYDQKLLLNK